MHCAVITTLAVMDCMPQQIQNYQGKEKESVLTIFSTFFFRYFALWARVVSTGQRRIEGADVVMSIVFLK